MLRLGIWMDSALTFNDHISKLSSSCRYNLRRINRIKHLLDNKTLSLIIKALIFGRLFYCSSLWGNTSSKNISKLQLIHNFACRIILGIKKFDHVPTARKSLDWLSIHQKLLFTIYILLLLFKSVGQIRHHLIFVIYYMIDLVCQDAALETCHSWIYLNADCELVNALSPFVGQKNTTYSQKTFAT